MRDLLLEKHVSYIREICSNVLSIRKQNRLNLSLPLKSLKIYTDNQDITDAVSRFSSHIYDECVVDFVKCLPFSQYESSINLKPNYKLLGKILGKNIKDFAVFLEGLDKDSITKIIQNNGIEFQGNSIDVSMLVVERQKSGLTNICETDQYILDLDISVSNEQLAEEDLNFLRRAINSVKKDNFPMKTRTHIWVESSDEDFMRNVMLKYLEHNVYYDSSAETIFSFCFLHKASPLYVDHNGLTVLSTCGIPAYRTDLIAHKRNELCSLPNTSFELNNKKTVNVFVWK